MISKGFLTRALSSSIVATGLTLAAAPVVAEQDDVTTQYLEDRGRLLKDGRLETLGINNFQVTCPEGLYSGGDSNPDKKVKIELNSVTLKEMTRDGEALAATRIQNPGMTSTPLTNNQSFGLLTNGQFKQLATMNDIISLSLDWIEAGKEPKGIAPSDEAGIKRIKAYALDFCKSRF